MARGGLLRAALVLLAALALVMTSTVDAKKSSKTGSSSAVANGSEKLAELHDRVRGGVVQLTGEVYEKLVLRPDRPYHLFLLFTATADKYSCDVCKYVSLPALRYEYSGDAMNVS